MNYSLKKATAWNLAGYTYLLIASFVTTPSLIRALGVEQFGRYALYLAIAAIISALDLGLSRSVVYHLVSMKKNQALIFGTSFFLYLFLAIIFTLPICIFVSIPLGLYIGTSFMLAHALTLPESQGDFGVVNLKSFLVGTGNTIGALLIALAEYGVNGIFNLLTLTVLVTYLLVHPKIKLVFDQQIAIKLVKYGLGNQLGKFVSQLQGNYAKFLLSSSPVALSAYSIGSSLVTRAVGGVTQGSTALFPYSVARQTDQKMHRLYHHLQLCLFVLGCLAIVLYQYFGFGLLSWWLGNPVLAQSIHSFLLVYRWYALFLLLTPLASCVVDAHGKSLATSLFGLIATGIEIILAIVLYPRIGLFAPAYAGLLSLGLLVPLFLIFTEKTLLSPDK